MRRLPAAFVCLLCPLAACGGSAASSQGVPPDRLLLPPVPWNGGRVVDRMIVVPIFYDNDAYQPALEGFLDALAAHTTAGMRAWFGAVDELNQQAGGSFASLTVAPSVVLHEPAPAQITDAFGLVPPGGTNLREYLRARVAAGVLPPYRAGMIYLLYPPASTVSVSGSSWGCVDYVGYHFHDAAFPDPSGNQDALYSVVLRCPPVAGGPNVLDTMTSVTSHELAEAATDPDLDANTLDLFDQMDEGEDGDQCAWELASDVVGTTTYAFQRMWSNREDLAGRDPCVPAATSYANTVALPDALVTTAGNRAHFDLHLISPDGSVPAGSPVGLYWSAARGSTLALDFTLPEQPPRIGDTVSLDVDVPAGTRPGFYWINFYTVAGLAGYTNSFAGIRVLP